ncbi:hypothetical protein PsYK624_154240 [Phanerochaete sordida]|uniref:Uncharacterized protein n=1 Tax=Phanerochaete sordida TaxID=48140 RepID=A0A9P3LL43_9APHY|nr:hypothetical protein PsYK624_154240 [Phanerochaete sordida]
MLALAVAHYSAGAFRPCTTLARTGMAAPPPVWRWALLTPRAPRTSWRQSRYASHKRTLRSRCNLVRGGAWGRRACRDGSCPGV